MFESEFKDNFSQLGELLLKWLDNITGEPLMYNAIALSYSSNPFFTPYMQCHAIRTIVQTFLDRAELERWIGNYSVIKKNGCGDTIGVIMAGNIPLVGFHDFLCVMGSGRRAVIKLSSKDKYLLPAICEILCRINPMWRERVRFVDRIDINFTEISALISTGSDSTVQAVAQEYAGVTMLLRGRRFSFAVLCGNENEQELEELAKDVFLYYGLGCRSVNYFLVPRGYNFEKLIESFKCMRTLAMNECYMNIYKRAKAVMMIEDIKFIDGRFFLMKQTDNVYSSIAELGYMEYGSESDILAFEVENSTHIQKKYRTFGLAQAPRIDEYADEIDVMNFIFDNSAAY